MSKRLKRIAVTIFCALMCFGVFALVGCGDKGNTDTPSGNDTYYTVTVESCENGSIAADKSKAKAGDTVTVTAAADDGYRLDKIYLDGAELAASGNTATFSMPEKNVTVGGAFLPADVYSITVGQTANATVSVDGTTAKAGATVTVSVSVERGYKLVRLLCGDDELAVTNGTATFVMPSASVVLSAVTALADDVNTDPASGFEISAAAGSKTATSKWKAVYGENALEISVYVRDEEVNAGDGVYLFVGRNTPRNNTLKDGYNFGVYAYSDGSSSQFKCVSGAYVPEEETDIFTVDAALWSEDGTTLCGYAVKMTAAYTALGLDGKPADGAITVLPRLNNYNGDDAGNGYYNDAAIDAQSSGEYYVLRAGALCDNEFKRGVNLGAADGVEVTGDWDLSKDYYIDDDDYADREAVLRSVHGQGSIAFFRHTGDTIYAEATIRYDGVFDNDAFGKFGIMLYDGSPDRGVFFYIDANRAAMDANRNTGAGFAPVYGAFGDAGYFDIFKEYSFENRVTFNGTTKTIKLGLAYKDDILSFYANDVLVHRLGYAAGDNAAIGIKSFNCGITVTDYFATTDAAEVAAHSPEFGTEAEEDVVLFAGDSYMHFLKLYGVWHSVTQEIETPENMGLGGSKVNYWSNVGRINEIKARYGSVDKIAMHIGVNDVDGGKSPQNTFAELKAMFELYKAELPDTELYWVAIVPNNFKIKNNNTEWYNDEYRALNALVREYAASHDGVTYVDTETPFTENGSFRQNMFASDGLHLNAVYGYPLWAGEIKAAMGYARVGEDNDFGSTERYTATAGFAYGGATDGYIVKIDESKQYGKTVLLEEETYYKSLYGANVLFEAEIKSSGLFNPDELGSAVGVILANSRVTVFAYFNTHIASTNSGKNVTQAVLAFRANYVNNSPSSISAGVGDWDWSRLIVAEIEALDVKDAYQKIGIAKVDKTIYLLVNGIAVAQTSDIPFVTADAQFTAGVMTFSRYFEVKSAAGTDDRDEIIIRLDETFTVGSGEYDDFTVELDKTSAKYGERVTVTVTGDTEMVDKVYAVYDGENHELTGSGFVYGFDMPHGDVEILVTLIDGKTVTFDGDAAQKMTASRTNVKAGTVVTLSPKDNVYIVKLYANGTEIHSVGGVYSITVNENVVITGEFLHTEGGVLFDGILSSDEGWTDEILSRKVSGVANGATVTLVGMNTAYGVRLGVIVDHDIPVTDRVKTQHNNWSDWLNVELRLNGDYNKAIQAGVLENYAVNCVMNFKTVDGTNGKRYTTTFEILVAHGILGSSSGDAVPVCIGGCYDGNFVWLFGDKMTDGVPFMHRVTDEGIMALNAEFDSFVWSAEAKAKTYTHSVAGVEVTVSAVKSRWGVTVGAVVKHNTAVGSSIQGDGTAWWNYQNIEFVLNGKSADGQRVAVTTWNHGAMLGWFDYTLEDRGADAQGYRYVTAYEIFVPFSNIADYTSGDVTLAIAGVFDGGFAPLFGMDNWTATHTITANGLVALSGDVCVNGVLDETVWTTGNVASSPIFTRHGTTATKIIAFNDEYGVHMAFIAEHDLPVTAALKDGTPDWSFYLNYEVRLAGDIDTPIQFVALNFYRVNCVAAWQTKTTDDGRYETTFEVFIPHTVKNTNATDPIRLYLGGVQSNKGFLWTVTNGDQTQYFITPDGFVSEYSIPAFLNGELTDDVWSDTVMSAEHTLSFELTSGAKATVNGVSAENGVLLGINIHHRKDISDIILDGGNATDWLQYQHIKVNLFAQPHAVIPIVPYMPTGGTGIADSPGTRFACKTVDNGAAAEYHYTTTYEIFLPFAEWNLDGLDKNNVALSLFVNADTFGYEAVYTNTTGNGIDWFEICGYITNNGAVARTA